MIKLSEYFTADLHNNHKNVIKYCNRPFFDLAGMRRELVKRWNSVVKNNDRVWVLGDIWDPDILADLQGSIVVVLGNHDSYNKLHTFYPDLELYRHPIILNNNLILSHVPLEQVRGTEFLNIHGHLHQYRYEEGTWYEGNRWFNCGVDLNNFTPVSLDAIRQQMQVWGKF